MSADPVIAPGPALIVEDDPDMRLRLRRLLGDTVGSESDIVSCADIASARAQFAHRSYGLALVDVGLPDGSGIDLIGWIHERFPDSSVVVVSCWGDEETVLAALRAGACGYLLKERDDAELRMALKCIHRGGASIDPGIARRILAHLAPPARAPLPASAGGLTERETEILNLVAQGYSNREIAELTGLSRFTVEDYTKHIYRKLAVGSRTAAVHEAKSRGLLQ